MSWFLLSHQHQTDIMQTPHHLMLCLQPERSSVHPPERWTRTQTAFLLFGIEKVKPSSWAPRLWTDARRQALIGNWGGVHWPALWGIHGHSFWAGGRLSATLSSSGAADRLQNSQKKYLPVVICSHRMLKIALTKPKNDPTFTFWRTTTWQHVMFCICTISLKEIFTINICFNFSQPIYMLQIYCAYFVYRRIDDSEESSW